MMPNSRKSTANLTPHQALSKANSSNDKPNKSVKGASRRSASISNTDGLNVNIAEILDTEYRGISLYAVAIGLLIIAILWTGVSVVEQIQDYHQRYGTLLKLKRDFRQLQIEHQRMLIEQQTFSATPQVTNRAIAELNMYYPDLSDRMILHSNQSTPPTQVSEPTLTDTASTPVPLETQTETPTQTLASSVQPE